MKVVFPVAGFGTRFLPATKATPKEMLPIVDKPLMQYAVDEAAAAGITEMIFITGRNKRAIEDYFDKAYELETELSAKGQARLLEQLRATVPPGVKFIFIRQGDALGLGHAVLCAQPSVGDSPFAVILADELMHTEPEQTTAIGQLVAAYQKYDLACIGVGHAPGAEIERYGAVAFSSKTPEGHMKLTGMVEKPKASEAPSEYGAFGRYVFPSRIFSRLETTKPGRGGEIQLTDAIADLIRDEGGLGIELKAQRYDCGTKIGFLEATIDFALRHPELGNGFRELLAKRVSSA
jgi:UTP--glucose-1-phosphate uridylyltransferase